MISENFTDLNNPTIVDIINAFNVSLGGYGIFGSLLALFIVLGLSAYNWSNDLLGSFLNSAYVIAIIGFILSLIKTSSGNRIFSFEQETFFIVLVALLYVGKNITD